MNQEGLLELARTVDPEPIAYLATRFLEIWSPPGGEGAIAAAVRDALLDAGVDDATLDEEIAGSPSVVAHLRGAEPGRTIQWHGHLDAMRTEHTPPHREGDLIYGRGASDMKGAIAANVASIRLLKACGLPRRGTVLITYHGLHEEGGSLPLRRLIERGVHGEAALIGELGSGPELVTRGRGLTFWEISVTRTGQSIHETNRPAGVIDPLPVGFELFRRLSDLREGLAAGAARPHGSLYIGKFVSGDYFNRVPLSATIAGTRRHHADSSLGEIRDQLNGIVDEVARVSGARIEAKIASLAEAYEVDPDDRLGRALRLAHFELTGERMTPIGSRATGNAVDFVRRAGIPAFYHGCAYASAHSDNEWLSVRELGRLAGAWALTTAHYLDGPEELAAPSLAESGATDLVDSVTPAPAKVSA